MAPRFPAALFETDAFAQTLTDEQAAAKRQIYDSMRPSRRKFVDRLGYDNWDPFQEPNHPLDMRVDTGMHTAEQLLNGFLRSIPPEETVSAEYRKGALDAAMSVITKDEKYRGVFDFCLWYFELMKKEGHIA